MPLTPTNVTPITPNAVLVPQIMLTTRIKDDGSLDYPTNHEIRTIAKGNVAVDPVPVPITW